MGLLQFRVGDKEKFARIFCRTVRKCYRVLPDGKTRTWKAV